MGCAEKNKKQEEKVNLKNKTDGELWDMLCKLRIAMRKINNRYSEIHKEIIRKEQKFDE